MKRFSTRYVLLTITALALLVWATALSLPNAFEAGGVISAAEMNENFTAVAAAVSDLEAQATALADQVAALEAQVEDQVVLPGYEGYFAYAWVDVGNGTPNILYSFNPTGEIEVASTETGIYSVDFGDASLRIRNVQVTAYGTSSVHCTSGGWSNHVATVRCYDVAGNLVDAQFNIWVVS